MSTKARKHDIEPKLFDFVIDYAQKIKAQKIKVTDALKKESPVVAFCSNFFLQFFANVLHARITGVDASAKARAIDIRLKLKGHDAERQLIFQFERLVDLWPDILGAGYGGSESDYLDFHTRYVPRLLERITAWARTTEDNELAHRAQAAQKAYEDAIKSVPEP